MFIFKTTLSKAEIDAFITEQASFFQNAEQSPHYIQNLRALLRDSSPEKTNFPIRSVKACFVSDLSTAVRQNLTKNWHAVFRFLIKDSTNPTAIDQLIKDSERSNALLRTMMQLIPIHTEELKNEPLLDLLMSTYFADAACEADLTKRQIIVLGRLMQKLSKQLKGKPPKERVSKLRQSVNKAVRMLFHFPNLAAAINDFPLTTREDVALLERIIDLLATENIFALDLDCALSHQDILTQAQWTELIRNSNTILHMQISALYQQEQAEGLTANAEAINAAVETFLAAPARWQIATAWVRLTNTLINIRELNVILQIPAGKIDEIFNAIFSENPILRILSIPHRSADLEKAFTHSRPAEACTALMQIAPYQHPPQITEAVLTHSSPLSFAFALEFSRPGQAIDEALIERYSTEADPLASAVSASGAPRENDPPAGLYKALIQLRKLLKPNALHITEEEDDADDSAEISTGLNAEYICAIYAAFNHGHAETVAHLLEHEDYAALRSSITLNPIAKHYLLKFLNTEAEDLQPLLDLLKQLNDYRFFRRREATNATLINHIFSLEHPAHYISLLNALHEYRLLTPRIIVATLYINDELKLLFLPLMIHASKVLGQFKTLAPDALLQLFQASWPTDEGTKAARERLPACYQNYTAACNNLYTAHQLPYFFSADDTRRACENAKAALLTTLTDTGFSIEPSGP